MPILVQLPNGKIAEFPDGMTLEQIESAIASSDQRLIVEERGVFRASVADPAVGFTASAAGMVPGAVDMLQTDKVPEAATSTGRIRAALGDYAADTASALEYISPVDNIERALVRAREVGGSALRGVGDFVERFGGDTPTAPVFGAINRGIGSLTSATGEAIEGDLPRMREEENRRRVAEGRPTLEQESAQQITSRAARSMESGIDDARKALTSDMGLANELELSRAADRGVGDLAQFVIDNPGDTLGAVGPQAAAWLLPSLAAGRVAKAANLTEGAATTAAVQGTSALAAESGARDVAQSVMEAPLEQLAENPQFMALIQQGYTEEQARLALAREGYDTALGSGLAIGAGTGAAAQKLGLAPVEEILATGGRRIGAGRIASALGAGLKEAPGEGMQGAGEAIASNLGQIDAGQLAPGDALKGVGSSAFLEAVAGGVMGGGVGLISPERDPAKVAEERVTIPTDLANPAGQGEADVRAIYQAALSATSSLQGAPAAPEVDAPSQSSVAPSEEPVDDLEAQLREAGAAPQIMLGNDAASAAYRQQLEQQAPSPSAESAERPQQVQAVTGPAPTPQSRGPLPAPTTTPRNLTRADFDADVSPLQTGYAADVRPMEPGEDAKPYLKQNIDTLPMPTAEQLPADSPLRYFSPDKADRAVPMSALIPSKNEEPGNAAVKRMAATAAGVIARRDAIDVIDNGDGTYTIKDGNGSYAAAKAIGLQDMPVRIVEAPEGMEAWRQNRGLLSPEQDAQLLAAYEQAAAELPAYRQQMGELAKEFGADVEIAPLKGRTRAEQKIAADYKGDVSRLMDVMRGTMTFEKPQQAIDAANKIRSMFKVVKDKDALSAGTQDKGSGYRDINLVIEMPGGSKAEIQLMTESMADAKAAGHKAYEVVRALEQKKRDGTATPAELAKYDAAVSEMEALYFATVDNLERADTNAARDTGTQEAGLVQSTAATPDTGVDVPSGENLTPSATGRSDTNANTSESLRSKNMVDPPAGGMVTPSNTSATSNPPSSSPAIVAVRAAMRAMGLSESAVQFHATPEAAFGADAVAAMQLDGQTEGLYLNGKVYLFTDQIASPARAIWVFLHEHSGHHGLRTLLGPKYAGAMNYAATNPLVKAIADDMRAQAKAEAEAGAAGARPLEDPNLFTEEALVEIQAAVVTGDFEALFSRYPSARAAGSKSAKGIVDRIISAIKAALGKAAAQMTNAELAQLLADARRASRQDGLATGQAMQSRSAVDESISYEVGPTGAVSVTGDPARVREILEARGITDKGIARGGVLTFTPNQSPRIINALRGETNAASRAGAVYDHVIKNGTIVGAPPKYNTEEKLEQLRAQLRSLATEAGDGRFWYERSGKEVLRMVGGDKAEARKFIQLLAIYSPQADIAPNYVFALRAWMQIKAGVPVNVKTGVQDRKAEEVVRDGKPWDGEKTNNFYINLMREVDPENYGPEKMGVTSDMWMARAMEFNTDAPNDSQYRFIEIETNRLAKELGWEPQQAQAAIWVSLKTRMNSDREANRRIDQESVAAGDLVINGQSRTFTSKQGELNHRNRWTEDALKRNISKEQMSFGEFNYADAISKYLGQVSWEARPGRSTQDRMDWVNDAPYEVQAEYQAVIDSALRGKNGEDMLAAHMGLPMADYVAAPGVWQGEVAAGGQSVVSLPLRKKPADYEKSLRAREQAGEQISDSDRNMVDPDAQRMVTAYAAILGRLLKQEGVGWHRPDYATTKRDANGVSLSIGRPLTPQEALSVAAEVEREFGAEAAKAMPLISAADGVRILNFSGMQNPEFHAKMGKVAAAATPSDVEIELQLFRADGALIENDWRSDSDGQGYRRAATEAGFGPASEWADRVLAPRIDRAQREFSERHGRPLQSRAPGAGERRVRRDDAVAPVQSRSFPQDAPEFRQRRQQRDAVSAQAIHYSGSPNLTSLDGKFAGAGSAGGERRRFGVGQYGERSAPGDTARRLYFYVQEGSNPPTKEDVVAGTNRYAVKLTNLYDYDADPRGFVADAGANVDYLEELVNDAGFDGMVVPPPSGIEGKIAILHGLKKKVPVVSAPLQSRAASTVDNRAEPGQPSVRSGRISRPPSYQIDNTLRRKLFGRELVLEVEVDGVVQELRGDAFRLIELAQKRADNIDRLAGCLTS